MAQQMQQYLKDLAIYGIAKWRHSFWSDSTESNPRLSITRRTL